MNISMIFVSAFWLKIDCKALHSFGEVLYKCWIILIRIICLLLKIKSTLTSTDSLYTRQLNYWFLFFNHSHWMCLRTISEHLCSIVNLFLNIWWQLVSVVLSSFLKLHYLHVVYMDLNSLPSTWSYKCGSFLQLLTTFCDIQF